MSVESADALSAKTETVQPVGSSEIESCLQASATAAYIWDVKADVIMWSANAPDVLGCKIDDISTGRLFAKFLVAGNTASRDTAVLNSKQIDEGTGVSFQVEYQFNPDGNESGRAFWMEDSGRWHADKRGRPVTVYGTLRRIDERHKRDQKLAINGTNDPLTGLFNRASMSELLDEAISNASRERSSCAFAIGAITNLAVINESYGFEVADEVILATAQRLRQVMRSGDAIARYSGSKFGFVFNNCTSNDLSHALERLMSAVRDNVIETSRGPVWPAMSIGAVSVPENAREASAAITFAEESLSEARSLANDMSVIYRDSEIKRAARTLNARCATEVVRCLKDGTFKLAFQPIVDAATGETAIHESLLRLEDSAGNIIPAGHLIPVSEKIGLVKLIDRNVLQMAITTLHSYPGAVISVNISGSSAMDPRWYRQLLELLETDASIARRTVIELPEGALTSNNAEVHEFLTALRSIGCRIAIDDFGSSYSSILTIKDLPVDFLKLDGKFCQNLSTSKESHYFASSLIGLSKTLGLKTIAEWVEKPEDAEILRAMGIDYLQGNYVAPASVDPPWSMAHETSFQLTEGPGADQAEGHQIEEADPTSDDAPAPSQNTGAAPAAGYSFEDGLSKLRDTLALLGDNKQAA